MKKILTKFLLTFLIQTIFIVPIFAQNLDEKIGQMIIIGFKGNDINSKSFKKVVKQIENNEISGVILFSKNIKDKENLVLMNKKLKSSSKIPVFISIDNEGGKIQRLNFANFKSAKELSSLPYEEIQEEYSKMAEMLDELEINVNFAPCVDLALNKNSIIEKKERSYGNNPQQVSKIASIMIEEHNKRKIVTSIKHFPGHGSATGDTHKGLVDNTKTFKNIELEPYEKLKEYDKLNMVMISHIFNSNIDEEYPASLSKKTINILKNEIGYKGVIISDDYDMKAIRDNYTLRQIVVNSINAGVDILLFSNNIEVNDSLISSKIHKIIKEEIKKGNIKEESIDASYKKIIELKKNLK